MAKILFINATKPETMNLNSGENAWKQTARVSSLLNRLQANNGQNTDICLYGLPQNVNKDDAITLYMLSAYANLLTVSNFMTTNNLFPLLLDGDTLYFTDIEEFSYLDGNWATDHVFKTIVDSNQLEFTPYQPQIPQGVELKSIAAQNINVGDLFEVVDNAFNNRITNFCTAHQNEVVEITYTDRYVKTELGLIITLQFIKTIIKKLNPAQYKVNIIGECYRDYDADEFSRRLGDQFTGDDRRDEVGEILINDNNYAFHSFAKKDVPHYRVLVIKVTDANNQIQMLYIHPDAGLAFWKLDVAECRRSGIYYAINSGINPTIPIFSESAQIYYIR